MVTTVENKINNLSKDRCDRILAGVPQNCAGCQAITPVRYSECKSKEKY